MNITNRQRTLIFINILISCIASSMLATALTTALPPLCEDMRISVTTGQWLTSGYSLAMGIMMPLTAFLITRFRTKRLYISAIVIFMAGLIICVLAPNFIIMMMGRILQASGNGILTSMAQVVLLTIYPPQKRGTIMGWYGLSVSTAPVLAPTLAGILVDSFGWRTIFYAAIAIMAVSLIFAVKAFDDVLDTVKRKFDIISFVLSIFAFGGITFGIGNTSSLGISTPSAWVPLAIGAVTGVVFVYRQFKLSEPFLELKILKSKTYALSVIGSMLLYFVMMGSSIIMPLYVQNIMGKTATVSGLVTLPGSLMMAVVSPFAGKIYDKLGMKMLFITGSTVMLASNIGMTMIGMSTPIIIASLLNVMRCISIGCLMMPLVTWGMSKIGSKNTAHGTALLTSLRTIAGAVGSAVFVGIMTMVGKAAADSYGDNAAMHGLNVTFAAMSSASVILLLIAVFLVGGKHNERK